MHRAKHAYDNSYDNPENVREALAYCGEQRALVVSVRRTEKDGKKRTLHTLSIGTLEEPACEAALEAASHAGSSSRFGPYDNCHSFIGSFGFPRTYKPYALHIIFTHYKVTLPMV